MKHPLASSYLMDFPGTSSNNNNSTYPSTNPNYSFPISSPSIFHENNPNCLHHLQDFSHHEQLVPILAHQETARNMEEYYTDQHLPINVLVNGSPGTEVFCYNTRQNIPVKRSSKKDRHSKIHTAHGPKDRRIRLSVDVAHRLFWLQDLLGLDNASKTVDWLLTKSKPAIEQNSLSGGNVATIASSSSNAPLNNSECKILSGIFDECASYSLPRASIAMEEAKSTAKREKKSMSPSGSRAFHLQEKERREGARARARERTKEKRIRLENSNYFDLLSKSSQCIEEMDQNMNRNHWSWSGEEQWSTAQIQLVNDYQPFLHIEEPIHQCISLQDATDNWSPSCFINCHQIASSSHENHLSIHGTSIKGSGIQEIGVDLIDISVVQDY